MHYDDQCPSSITTFCKELTWLIVLEALENDCRTKGKMLLWVLITNQCSLVAGKNSYDNVLVAEEIIHSVEHKKGDERFHGHLR